eukprot:GHVU01144552.1.p1 GENE.GHVU01144552.1~~GHVU01144552.1.p1  ORF type:complete len:433 (+),score=34.05 GHVU01144552.1:1581-2879(+)
MPFFSLLPPSNNKTSRDFLVIAESPLVIDVDVFESWANGLTVQECVQKRLETPKEGSAPKRRILRNFRNAVTMLHRASAQANKDKASQDDGGVHSPAARGRKAHHGQEVALQGEGFYSERDHDVGKSAEPAVSAPTPEVLEHLTADVRDHYRTCEQLAHWLAQPEFFGQFCPFPIGSALQQRLLLQYYSLDECVLKELLRGKKPLAAKGSRIAAIARATDLRVPSVQRQVANIKTTWKMAMGSDTGGLSDAGSARSDSSFNKPRAYLERLLQGGLGGTYWRFFFLCFRKVDIFPKRFPFLDYTDVDYTVENLCLNLGIASFDLPLRLAEYSKKLCNPSDELLLQQQSRDSRACMSLDRLRTLMAFHSCFRSPNAFSAFFSNLLDVLEKHTETQIRAARAVTDLADADISEKMCTFLLANQDLVARLRGRQRE